MGDLSSGADIAAGRNILIMDDGMDSSIIAQPSELGDFPEEQFSGGVGGDESTVATIPINNYHSAAAGAAAVVTKHIDNLEHIAEGNENGTQATGVRLDDLVAEYEASVSTNEHADVSSNTNLNGHNATEVNGNASTPQADSKHPSPRSDIKQAGQESPRPMNGMPQHQPSGEPPFKFQYEPLDFESGYYDKLFSFAKENKEGNILPPNEAARLFMSSGIPSDRLRMIWNMAVMPVTPYPPGMKPPPVMALGQFRSAVRLIQLFQNRVTAKDETLRVSEGVMMAPAYFEGVSGVIVPLPWKGMSPSGSSTRRRHSMENLNRSHSPDEEKKWSPTKNQSSPTTMVAYGAEDGYNMSESEFFTYRETFLRHCVTEDSGPQSETQHVYVDEAVSLFEKSGLDRKILGQIWDVVVTDPDSGKLDEEDFVLMAHLIVCVTRRGATVPTELPAPLRTWRKNRLLGDHGHHTNGGEAGQINGDHNTFTPVVVSPSESVGDENSVTEGVQTGVNRNMKKVNDDHRINQMEEEIRSLKKTVESLKMDIQELKDTARRGAVDGSSRSGSRRPHYDSSSRDDIPNIDVEMYWGEKSDQHEPDPTFEYSNPSLGIQKPPTHPTPSATASAIRHAVSTTRSSKASRDRTKQSPGMSQNVPVFHHSSSTRAPRRPQSMHRSEPQSRVMEDAVPPVSIHRGGVAKSMMNGTGGNLTPQTQQGSIHRGGVSKSMMNGTGGNLTPQSQQGSVHRGGVAKSMINGTGGNLASQMQQVQREDKFDSLLQKTRVKLGRQDSGSHAGSHASKASSRFSRSRGDLQSSFKPAQLNSHAIKHRRKGTPRRGSLTKQGLVDSAQHITRKKFGQSVIYTPVEAPSTAALDLPPL